MNEETIRLLKLVARLSSYSRPSPNENWKLDMDLTHCTKREQEEIARNGLTIELLGEIGLTRGEVHHILFGYNHAGGRR